MTRVGAGAGVTGGITVGSEDGFTAITMARRPHHIRSWPGGPVTGTEPMERGRASRRVPATAPQGAWTAARSVRPANAFNWKPVKPSRMAPSCGKK